MNLSRPATLEHGDRFGSLTVIAKAGRKWKCGCACGNSYFYAKANELLRGKVRECNRHKVAA